MENIEKIINDAWENKEKINSESDELIINAINQIIENLDQGKLRVAEKIDGNWKDVIVEIKYDLIDFVRE